VKVPPLRLGDGEVVVKTLGEALRESMGKALRASVGEGARVARGDDVGARGVGVSKPGPVVGVAPEAGEGVR